MPNGQDHHEPEAKLMDKMAVDLAQTKAALEQTREALRDAIPYVNGVYLDNSNSPWRRETAKEILDRLFAALEAGS